MPHRSLKFIKGKRKSTEYKNLVIHLQSEELASTTVHNEGTSSIRTIEEENVEIDALSIQHIPGVATLYSETTQPKLLVGSVMSLLAY